MTNQTITIFLPILFAVLILCGVTLCACAYCQRSRGLPTFSFLHVFSRTERDDYDEEKVVETVRVKKKKKKSSSKKKGARKGGAYGMVQTTTHFAHHGSMGHPPGVPRPPGAYGGPRAEAIDIHDVEPSEVEEIEVITAEPGR